MIKLLHSADWHLDSPMADHTPEGSEHLKKELRMLPQRIVSLAKAEACDLILLGGDLFEENCSRDTVRSVQQLLAEAKIPVVIAPGNHDYVGQGRPYDLEGWPENVHIFRSAKVESLVLEALSCCIYGAGYQAMDCPPLLKHFTPQAEQKYHIGLLHAEADTATSPYCPITKEQVKNSGLDYLALGHIHKGGSFRAGQTLCAWPGCPMGHGFDECGTKGVILATLDDSVSAMFLPLDTPRFYDEDVDVEDDPRDALCSVLPALPSQDFYRITLNGYHNGISLSELYTAFPHIPNLTLRDHTIPEPDLWTCAGEDTLEGMLFTFLQTASRSESDSVAQRAKLAARICRQILDGQEVKLP